MNSSPQIVVIIGNGEDWQKEKIIHFCLKADYIIAADNGLALLHRFNIAPELLSLGIWIVFHHYCYKAISIHR